MGGGCAIKRRRRGKQIIITQKKELFSVHLDTPLHFVNPVVIVVDDAIFSAGVAFRFSIFFQLSLLDFTFGRRYCSFGFLFLCLHAASCIPFKKIYCKKQPNNKNRIQHCLCTSSAIDCDGLTLHSGYKFPDGNCRLKALHCIALNELDLT